MPAARQTTPRIPRIADISFFGRRRPRDATALPPKREKVVNRSPNRILASMPREAFAALEPHVKPFEFKHGAVLADTGTPIKNVYFPHSPRASARRKAASRYA